MDECLDLIREYRRCCTPDKAGAFSPIPQSDGTFKTFELPEPFEILVKVFGVCPAAFQWDARVQRAIELAHLAGEYKLDVGALPRRLLGDVLHAAGVAASFVHKTMPKPKDVTKKPGSGRGR